MAEPVLQLANINKSFGPIDVLHDISLSVKAGEVLCLLGDNGAGKSTLIKILSGVHQPTSGTILMDGKPTALPARVRARLFVRDLRRTRGPLLARQLRRVRHKARLATWSVRAGGRVPCHFLQGAVFITLSGDVAPCPMPGRPVAGNLNESSFAEIWNGQAKQKETTK